MKKIPFSPPDISEQEINEVIEAMFAIDDNVHPDSVWWRMGEDQIQDWLWNEYYENCVPYIEEAFLNRHNSERNF